MTFDDSVLKIDTELTIERIVTAMRSQLRDVLRRRGIVLGISGGIDSSVTAALAARAVGPKRVLGILMPEGESDPDSLRLGQLLIDSLGIEGITEDVTALLEAAGCYRRRDEALKASIPEYGPGWKSKIALPPLESQRGPFRLYDVVAQSPEGEMVRKRLERNAYLGVVAATNFKQRCRKMLEYYHADRIHYAVAGTPNRLEYDQGFFVKNGDGAADIKPIAHLYKSQVYALAEALDLPEEIRARPPTTDTYALEQSQDEFYFSLPYREMDLCLWGFDHGVAAAEVAPAVGLDEAAVERVYVDIQTKRSTTSYGHLPPLLVEHIAGVDAAAAEAHARAKRRTG